MKNGIKKKNNSVIYALLKLFVLIILAQFFFYVTKHMLFLYKKHQIDKHPLKFKEVCIEYESRINKKEECDYVDEVEVIEISQAECDKIKGVKKYNHQIHFGKRLKNGFIKSISKKEDRNSKYLGCDISDTDYRRERQGQHDDTIMFEDEI